ncbi:Hypothetical predicted protein [Mytilus galloprovincialis]|uniref:Novel STAND NTPase 3 domain-containing protein n=1 Tax=Mytilus galloprovincialis TaxID=29158 RepID=A0A8B6EZX2_MYTGA|nr:Hypothetical predicted protein [Mytilus galloprovincialis]
MFVSTRASDYVMEQLQDNSCLTLTAPSGVGKSFIARHTALLLKKEGYNIIPVYSPTDIRDYYQPGKQTVFIVDDICGNFTANQQQIDNWKQLLPVIKTINADKCYHGDSDLVHERFIWQKSPDDKNSNIDFIIEIPDDYLESYLQRFIKDWSTGKVTDVFSNINMEVFIIQTKVITVLTTTRQTTTSNISQIQSKDTVVCYLLLWLY